MTGHAGALTDLGIIRGQMGDLTGADADLRRAVAEYGSQSDRQGQASALVELAIVRRLPGKR
jgi:hypothetical protein